MKKSIKNLSTLFLLPALVTTSTISVTGVLTSNNITTNKKEATKQNASVQTENVASTNSSITPLADSQAWSDGQGSTTTDSNQNLIFNLDKENLNSQYSANKFYAQNDMPNVTNANGPILLNDDGRTIAAYDWYGNPAWFLTLNSSNQIDKSDAQASYYKYSNALSTQIPWDKVGSKVVDIAYLTQKDFLYVLTDTSYLFLIQSQTGTINSVAKIGDSTNTINKIGLIHFDNSLYGWNTENESTPVYNIDTQKLTTTTGMERTSATGIKGKYIFDILPLDVGYNIALLSDQPIYRNGTQTPQQDTTPKKVNQLTGVFVQDDGNNFSSSTGATYANNSGVPQITIKLESAPTTNASDSTTKANEGIEPKNIYSTTLARNGSYTLMVGNNVYNIILNKSAMENTQVTQIAGSQSTTQTGGKENGAQTTVTPLYPINSAFIDANNFIYLKDENPGSTTSGSSSSTTIYQVTADNKVVANVTIPTTGSGNLYTGGKAANAKIFPVLSESNSQVSRASTGYIAEPSSFIATGFTNGSLMKTNFVSATQRPSFTLSGSNFSRIAPSSIEFSNLQIGNKQNVISIDQYNTSFFSNDITGELYIKTKLNVVSWYNTSSINASTTSYVIGKWTCAKISTVTTWVSQQTFSSIANGIFAKRDPNQISDADVTKYADQILNLPSVVTTSPFKQVDIIIVDRPAASNNGKKNQIKLQATIKYQNANGTIVSYIPLDATKTYEVKAEANEYKFKFYGGVENEPTSGPVNIGDLGSTFTSFKNTLPSLIKPTSENLDPFIEIQDKYPTDSRRVITITEYNDELGTMTVEARYNHLAPETPSVFTIKYTGLATTASMQVNFEGETIKEENIPVYNGKPVFGDDKNIKEITTIPNYANYNEKLATQVTSNELNLVYESNLKNMGFTPKLTIVKDKEDQISSTDAEYGSITVQLDYTDSYSEQLGIKLPSKYWNLFGLKEGIITQRYIGFLPIGATYGIELKSYNSPQIQSLVKDNNVDALIQKESLIDTLNIRGYNEEGVPIQILNYYWDGEDLYFTAFARSKKYNTVSTNATFKISWSPKFAAVRERNLAIAVVTSVVGAALVAVGVALYIMRRNKIRKLLK